MNALDIVNLSRRDFLKTGAGLTLGTVIPQAFAQAGPGRAGGTAVAAGAFEPNAFIRIGTDSSVTVIVKHLEMGQGTYTSISMLVAEELEVELSQVQLEHAPANGKLYANPLLGVQATAAANAAIVARSTFLLRVPDLVPVLRSVLAPHVDRVVLRGTVTAHGPGAYYLGLLAWLAADAEQVMPLFERALDLCRRMHAPGWRAHVEYDAATWLAQEGADPRRAGRAGLDVLE